jgi:hypothetical protein
VLAVTTLIATIAITRPELLMRDETVPAGRRHNDGGRSDDVFR